jgi:tetratricopeptide (TPR) repeat protein
VNPELEAAMAYIRLTGLLTFLFLAGAANPAPAQPLSREQARHSLTETDVQARRLAAARLGEIGLMGDLPALRRALRDADADTREHAENAMWRIWERSGNQQVDRLYQAGVAQMKRGELHRAIATFTRIIELKPGFAEGWNKRATLYFLAGEYRKSLADCAEVIKRNPYHFGALAGYGQIYLRLEDYERSLEYFERALEVNPNMDSVRRNIDLLGQLIERRRKNMI